MAYLCGLVGMVKLKIDYYLNLSSHSMGRSGSLSHTAHTRHMHAAGRPHCHSHSSLHGERTERRQTRAPERSTSPGGWDLGTRTGMGQQVQQDRRGDAPCCAVGGGPRDAGSLRTHTLAFSNTTNYQLATKSSPTVKRQQVQILRLALLGAGAG